MEDTTATTTPTPTPTSSPKKEGAPKITKEKKEKNPMRVAQGKRLAAISKEAKEKKARERILAELREESWNVDYGVLFGALGITVAVGVVLYSMWSPRGDGGPKVESKPPVVESKPKRKEKSLESLD